MKNIARLLFVALLMMGVTISGKARVYHGEGTPVRGNQELKQTTAGCSPSSAYEWLDINNVKTRYNAGGDMWWDLPGGIGAQYFIPANGSATSLFAGALWIAGLDINLQLKCSAVKFRQGPLDLGLPGGNDFWTGPLTLDGASIDAVTCAQWDRLWKINRSEVDDFISHLTGPKPDAKSRYGTFVADETYTEIPKIIREWPAHPEVVGGNVSGCSHYMAPFYDNNFNGEYEPEEGDFPYYDITNELCHTKTPTLDEQNEPERIHGSILSDQVLKGDQTIWWVFNDKGNSHTESFGEAIGLEIRAQAFGFSTNDEINNMSFCSYEIINRSTYELTGTYFSPWTDVDLGYAQDDYVGCDVQRGLGYGYNGNQIDGNGQPEAYGDQPPAVGVDFFQGPYMDADGVDNPKYRFTVISTFSGLDPITGDSIFIKDTTGQEQLCDESINGVNFGNGIVDDERFGMRRFLYHENGASTDGIGDPQYASDYYNFLRGIWSNGSPMVYGGNALNDGVVGPECVFMFPGDTDPCNWGTNGIPPGDGYNTNGKYWTDETNPVGDRRFMQSAGPFTLKPGAVNYITFGVPWARATSGGPKASVELLRVTDDKCQALFDNCFKVIDGPSAPDLTIRELDQKLIIYLSYSSSSNNYKESYVEEDPEIPEYRPDDSTMLCDRNYRFEGYKVYQLLNNQVGADELDDNSKARLLFQCDIENGVSKLVNYEWDEHIGGNVPTLKVEGGDAGITHSFVVTDDLFSTGESVTLVNHKTYYYMAVAYAYNNYMDYAQDPNDPILLSGQQKPYLEGRKDIKCYSAVPHKIINGTVLQCEYGQKPGVTRLVGQGNGGNELELTDDAVAELFTKKLANSLDENGEKVVFGHPDYPILYHPSYKVGYGPLDVKVIDPLNVKAARYELWFDDMFEVKTYNVSTNNKVRIPIDETQPISKENNKIGSVATRMASHWYLKDLDSDEDPIKSDTITTYSNEMMFIDRGISITVAQPYKLGPTQVGHRFVEATSTSPEHFEVVSEALAKNGGMITSSLTFQDSTDKWLDGIRDKDLPGSELNWIRSGTYYDDNQVMNSDYNMNGLTPWDPSEGFEKIANRTWAPFALCAQQANTIFPVPNCASTPKSAEYFARTSSVDIVLTADRSKWTRCPVVELCSDQKLSEGGAKMFQMRKAASVDKDGNPYMVMDETTGLMVPFTDWAHDTTAMYVSDNPEDPNYISPQGMGWFPGYAIDIESGARLNIIYGEDSYLEDLNGRDMMFNPPALKKTTVDEALGDNSQYYDPVVYRQVDRKPVFGGKHYVYIMGMDTPTDIPGNSPVPASLFDAPAYDAGQHYFDVLFTFQNKQSVENVLQNRLWRQAMYIGMPMAVEGTNWLGLNPTTGECNDAKIRIRVAKPYDKGYATIELDSVYPGLDINDMNPKYEFTIEGLAPVMNDPAKIESDLDLVNIVPNPYYAFSQYEDNALNNKVKITNLPNNCTVTIYNLSGTKIRQFKKDNELPSIEWDLTNFANTPVASGFYLIHVKDNASGGERTIKFFGAMRLIDLNTF